MAETVRLKIKSPAEAKRILQRFKGKKLSMLSRQQLQTMVGALAVLLPPSTGYLKFDGVDGEA